MINLRVVIDVFIFKVEVYVERLLKVVVFCGDNNGRVLFKFKMENLLYFDVSIMFFLLFNVYV